MNKNIVENYRCAYRAYFKSETKLSDEQIWDIYSGSPVMPTSELQDNYVLEELHFATLELET